MPSLLLEVTIKVSLVLLIALALVWCLRHRSAAARHWVLSVAVVSALVLPLLGAVAPSWSLPVYFTPVAAIWSNTSVAPAGETSGDTAAALAGRTGHLDRTGAAVPSTIAAPQVSTHDGRGANVRLALIVVWSFGMGVTLLVLLAGLGRLGRLRSTATPVMTGPWRELADEIGVDLALSRPVQLLQSRHPTILATWGVIWPKVMLPAGAQAWPRHRARIVLAHELAHVHHGDWATQMCAELLRAALWFNPLTWIALHRLRRDSELACDDEVLGLGVDGSDYATQLLDLAKVLRPQRTAWSPGVAMARSSGFQRRITAMMNPSLRRQPLMRGARAAVAVAALCFTVPLAMLAQSGSASFEGTVVDSSGAPWSGAQVTLSPVGMDQLKARLAAEQDKAEALKQEFEDQDVLESFKRQMEALTAQTDEAGRFLIGDVPPGDYSVRVRKPGFVELEETVSLAASQRVRRDFSMTIGSIEETVNVSTGDAVPVPTSADRETLERLRARLSGGRLQPPVKVRSLNPAYPEDLRGSGAEGQVILETLVSAGGSVEVLNVLTPVDPDLLTPVQPELARAAVTAVRQWQYQATRLNDLPVDTRMTVTINFTDES